MEVLTIGKLARRGGVNLETVRYYERRGLMVQPDLQQSGHRVYSTTDVRRLRFIRSAQQLGFSLAEIKAILDIGTEQASDCGEVARQIDAKIFEVDVKITELRTIRRTLSEVRKSCDGRHVPSKCPIIEALGREGA